MSKGLEAWKRLNNIVAYDEKQLEDYVGSGIAYAIHITKLEIFNKPKKSFVSFIKLVMMKNTI